MIAERAPSFSIFIVFCLSFKHSKNHHQLKKQFFHEVKILISSCQIIKFEKNIKRVSKIIKIYGVTTFIMRKRNPKRNLVKDVDNES